MVVSGINEHSCALQLGISTIEHRYFDGSQVLNSMVNIKILTCSICALMKDKGRRLRNNFLNKLF